MKTYLATDLGKIRPDKLISTSFGLHDGLRMFYTAKVNGEELGTWKSDSFVQYFAYLLESHFQGYTLQDTNLVQTGRWNVGEIVDVTEQGDHVRIQITTAESYAASTTRMLWLQIDSLPHLNGMYWYRNNELQPKEGEFTYVSGTGTSGIVLDLYNKSMNGLTFDAGQGAFHAMANSINSSSANTFQNAQIIVGADNTPVDMWDLFLRARYFDNASTGLVYGGVTHDPLQITQEHTTFRLKRSFSNQTASDVYVRELGVMAGPRRIEHRGALIIRDVPSSEIIVPPGGSLEVIYDIRSTIENITQDTDVDGTNKGLLTPFMDSLRTSMASLSGSISWYARDFGLFRGTATGVYQPNHPIVNTPEGFGVVVGTSNQYVSQTDTGLFEQIEHGSGDGKLFSHGLYKYPFEANGQESKFTYRFGRLFTNEGTTPITIKESGLYLRADTSSRALFMRAALHESDWVTVEPGETVKAEIILNLPV